METEYSVGDLVCDLLDQMEVNWDIEEAHECPEGAD